MHSFRRGLTLALCLVLLLTGSSLATDSVTQARIIRVGCPGLQRFLTLDAQGRAQGYAAEYLNAIAQHTGWQYEYIPGTIAQNRLRLSRGQLDLLLPLEHADTLQGQYLFSQQPCSEDYATLLCRKEDNSFYFNDPQSYQGMAVGLLDGYYLNGSFERYLQEN